MYSVHIKRLANENTYSVAPFSFGNFILLQVLIETIRVFLFIFSQVKSVVLHTLNRARFTVAVETFLKTGRIEVHEFFPSHFSFVPDLFFVDLCILAHSKSHIFYHFCKNVKNKTFFLHMLFLLDDVRVS